MTDTLDIPAVVLDGRQGEAIEHACCGSWQLAGRNAGGHDVFRCDSQTAVHYYVAAHRSADHKCVSSLCRRPWVSYNTGRYVMACVPWCLADDAGIECPAMADWAVIPVTDRGRVLPTHGAKPWGFASDSAADARGLPSEVVTDAEPAPRYDVARNARGPHAYITMSGGLRGAMSAIANAMAQSKRLP